VLHLGDTVFHGAWWQMARRAGPFDAVFAPVNGAVIDFPHQQPTSPLPATLEPEQAALAGESPGCWNCRADALRGLCLLAPLPTDSPIPDARERFERAARGRPYRAAPLVPGEAL